MLPMVVGAAGTGRTGQVTAGSTIGAAVPVGAWMKLNWPKAARADTAWQWHLVNLSESTGGQVRLLQAMHNQDLDHCFPLGLGKEPTYLRCRSVS